MHRKFATALIAGIFAIQAGNFAQAQQNRPPQSSDRGKYEYDMHCAVCHGPDGKGHGPFAQELKLSVSDLTTLAKKNGGVFPFMRVFETIDGTQSVTGHGSRQMPIWGPRYKAEVGESVAEDYRSEPEAFVRARILALTEYVYRLQAK